MSEDKLSSDEVPGKFTEWLLAMGCPPEKVPSVENIAQLCRGQYYMVWRSLMEQTDAKDVIRNKRLQVFCNDVKKCKKNKVFCKRDSKTIVPEQLSQWQQQTELKRRVEEAAARVALAQRDLDLLNDKINGKLCQRELSRRSISDRSRRLHFLQLVAADLKQKSSDLKETRTIADSLCSFDTDDGDVQSKIDKCMSSFRRQSPPALSSSNVSVVSTNRDGEFDEQVWSGIRSGGTLMCSSLYERRAALVRALHAPAGTSPKHNKKVTPQSVLAHTAALHCTLSLEATKNKLHLQQARHRLVASLTDVASYLTGESSELLVLRCERAYLEARTATVKTLIDDMATNSGVFYSEGGGVSAPGHSLLNVDRAIESKKEELKRTMSSLTSTERKIQSVRECLGAVFAAFRGDCPLPRNRQYRGIQLDLPSESFTELRQFYSQRNKRKRVDLSLNMDNSDCSLSDIIDYNNPRYVDELRIYLKKFDLNNNRQLVLDSGEKVWIFETVQSSTERLYTRWLADDTTCALLYPGDSLTNSLTRLVELVAMKGSLEDSLRTLKCDDKITEIDIKQQIKEEDELTDRIKKRLRANMVDLQKVAKSFIASQDNLRIWSENNIRKYISPDRRVDGVKYKDYEIYYLESCVNI